MYATWETDKCVRVRASGSPPGAGTDPTAFIDLITHVS
jgi:hypothetical protein